MRICILSDSHDHRGRLAAAVESARARGAEVVLHAGDVVAPSTLSVLEPLGLPVHVVHGNNAGDLFVLTRMAARKGSVIRYHGADADLELAGRRVFVVHYPHDARGMASLGDWDLVCCGHSHRTMIERVPNVLGGTTVLVDAGTVGGVAAPASYVLGDLETLDFEVVLVPD
jgi:putative phosphoesterase